MKRYFLFLSIIISLCLQYNVRASQTGKKQTFASIAKLDKAGEYNAARQELEKLILNKSNKNWGQASFVLANYYFESRKGIAKDVVKAKKYYNQAMEAFMPKAEIGDAEAQYIVGICLKNLRKKEEAYAWLLKSAKNGNSDAQTAVSLCLIRGKGIKRNAQTAITWLKKAVANDNMEAKAYLASYYLSRKENMEEGIKLAKESSDAGNAAGQYTLGMAYQKERGVPKNLEKAVELFRLAAGQGQKDAIVRLKWTEKLLEQKTKKKSKSSNKK